MSWFVSELAEKNSFDVSNDESRVAQVFLNLFTLLRHKPWRIYKQVILQRGTFGFTVWRY